MYLYKKENLGENRTSFRPCSVTTNGLGQNPWEQIPRDQHERVRELIRNNPVVQAIRSLPEGKVCPAPEFMAAHEQRIREKIRGFLPGQIDEGINLWRLSLGYPPHPAWQQRKINTSPSMSPISAGEKIQSDIYTAKILEEKFRRAELSDDAEGMAIAAEQYYQLLNRYPPPGPGQPMPGRGAMERQREQIAQIRDNILRQAPNLASIVRNIGPWELAVVRGRIAEYVRQRVLVRQQRTRARR